MTKDSTQVASFVCCLTEILGIKLSKQLIERDKSSASLFPHLSFFSTNLLLGRGGRPDHATGVVTKVMQSHLTLVPVERQTQTTKMNMAFTKFFGLGFILLFYSVAFASESINPGKVAESELISKDRIHAGKSKMEEFTTNAKSSDCWRKAVEGIKVANRSKVANRLSGKGVWKTYPLTNAPAPLWQASVERKRGLVIHGWVLNDGGGAIVLRKESTPPTQVRFEVVGYEAVA